ncbi:ADP-ribosyltransferase [Enterococcus gallinarum]|uniref:ADP-ribosyltransferase n=1 Tax=Enterococcus gallinarum TaxID=1353 RepID=A0ABD4HNE9_ENTGA|nr:ADP-ribosyltransferase [Enterococcus gallinarum]MBF0824598.1 minor capsid protein [Enterococcus faecalis]MBA0948667.1 minor capsid protein [Enterococcus gallinarum]MBA0961699.1 minor capsid protein [Enterococcus gallinarum]MBA0969637.1 minor capsid protein [Enterococcus gallinarum]MBA0972999.1 minor capsid protein [Enterococcus gallinarum]
MRYWQKRYLQISIDRDRKDQDYIRQMQKEYRRLSKSMYKEIKGWIDRYADNDQISSKEAQQILSKKEQKTWSMTLEQFRQKAISGGYEQELNREYFKSRISRLEQLQRQLYFELAEMANNQEAALQSYLKESLNESYLRQIYELTDQGAFSLDFSRYSSYALQVAISKPWKGNNFSGRIWKNHLKTIPDRLSKTMSLSILHGWGVDRTVKEMMFGIDSVLRNRMTTLVQTESAHLAEVANDKAMAETGVEEWEWLATFEAHTCDRCGGFDGKTSKELKEKLGYIPSCPDHPNCRCTRVPVIDGWKSKSRWHRDPITGKGSVENYQTFDQWKKSNTDEIKQAQEDAKSSKTKYAKVKKEDFDKFIKQSGKVSARDKKILYEGKDGYIGTTNSFKINEFLRNNEINLSDASKNTIRVLDRVIKKNTLKQAVSTNRWVENSWLQDYAKSHYREIGSISVENLLKHFNSGSATFESSGFVSTSLVPSKNLFNKVRNIKMEIEVPKGAQVFVTENHIESEMILNKGSFYEIMGAEIRQLANREIMVIKMLWKG